MLRIGLLDFHSVLFLTTSDAPKALAKNYQALFGLIVILPRTPKAELLKITTLEITN